MFYELLTKNARNSYRTKHVGYDKWYVLGSPKVTYSLPKSNLRTPGYGDFLPGFNTSLNSNWHEIQSKEYNKIIWSYSDVFRRNLICNGFIISESYKLRNNKINPPTLIIYDFDAKLPLNLSRTSVGFPLSFNDQLETDIYKDFLAKLLVMSIENPFHSTFIKYKPTFFKHPSFDRRRTRDYALFSISEALLELETIIFCKEGFLLNHPLSIKQIEGYNHLKIFDSYHNATKLELFPNLYKFNLLNIEAISLSPLSDSKQDRKSELKQIGRYFIRSGFKDIIGWTESFNQGGEQYAEIQAELNENIRKLVFLEDFLRVGVSFIFYKVISTNRQNDLFESILIDLLGAELIIPYKIEDRKKKFPKAFKELEPYMRKYLKEK